MAGLTAEDLAGRKRAAVELIAREGANLRQAALRFSLCAEDAEDAYQRALEILLTKAPSGRQRELARWTQTVVKHEALAIRRYRERMLGGAGVEGEAAADRIARLPASGAGPDEATERRERLARSREALQALKPAELRALTLLAAGYSYVEIGEITGFSQTKVNRCLAEGRERFRGVFARSEDGRRCVELRPLLSAYCDGEAGAEQAATVREHLRACGGCRATMRAYRSAPAAVAALAPALPASRSLLERAHELFAGLQARLPGAGAADASLGQVAAAGGTRGAGMAALAKALTICAGTVGGAAACVATGIAPAPLELAPDHPRAAKVKRFSEGVLEEAAPPPVAYAPAPSPDPAPAERREKQPPPEEIAAEEAPPIEAGAVEYTAPPVTETPPTTPASASNGSAAGEFGP